MVQHIIFAMLFVIVVFYPTFSDANQELEDSMHDESVLRESFRPPLQLELLSKGLTPSNTEIATQFALDKLAECWKSDRNATSRSEQRTTVVRLGGKSIVTYASPCIEEFLIIVGEIAK